MKNAQKQSAESIRYRSVICRKMQWTLAFFGLLGFLAFSPLQEGHCSRIPNFDHLENSQGVVILLSTKRSGSNWVSGSLLAITRKPISWLWWRQRVLKENSKFQSDPSYNRLNLPLDSRIPLLYRTHTDFDLLEQFSSDRNKLILITRNPKELLYRENMRTGTYTAVLDRAAAENFLNIYMQTLRVYDSWASQNRFLVYYEDFINDSEQILLNLLGFMGESPTYFDDYIEHREFYNSQLLDSYQKQHATNGGTISARNGPKPIFYTDFAQPEDLLWVDEYLKSVDSILWENYLVRFSEDRRGP